MKELNELVEALYPQYGAPGSRDVDITARRKAIDESATAIAEAFRLLEQRAEAAEAKLAELEKQEPVAVVARREPTLLWEWTKQGKSIDRPDGTHLYARPTPAINLAELVPPKMVAAADMALNDIIEARIDGWNDCRAAILNNIEGAE